jgi:hypothetical protein
MCYPLRDAGTERCLPALKEAHDDKDRNVAAMARAAVRNIERRLGLPSSTPEKAPRKECPRPARKSTRTPKGPRPKGTS